MKCARIGATDRPWLIRASSASRLHRAEGFYLPGIFINFASLAVFAGSVLFRFPLIGLVWPFAAK